MPIAQSKATFDLHLETPPHTAPLHASKADPNDEPYEELEITFNKTLEGHYRHGKTGYNRVGVLFLTWEVDALRDLFANEFKYETKYFQIPKERWQTALQREVANLFYEYDSPDCLTIIYYGGHGYIGQETRSLKLSAKMEADATGDPTLFMNDILGCCRLPACDQLLILDCCYAANAFGPEHIGKRKFEMIVSSGYSERVPAPLHPGSFTKSFHKVLRKLLRDNPTGFVTSQLYREIYHSISHETKPWLFDQARRDYGRIWLRPQAPPTYDAGEPKKGGAFLNLTLKLNQKPDSIVMNQLAMSLQYLPHIELVRFEKLYAPKKQIEDFMQYVRRAVKLRPLVRKLHAKRRLKKLMALPQKEKQQERPWSFMKLWMDQKHPLELDWSGVLDDHHNPSPSSPVNHHRRKSFTWPPVEGDSSVKRKTFSNRLISIDSMLALPTKSILPGIFQPRRVKTLDTSTTTPGEPRSTFDFERYRYPKLALLNPSSFPKRRRKWKAVLQDVDFWHIVMWLALCYALICICYHMRE
ncbi:MAG: hypothetical protein Q9220_007326 [cf. Caloplaca sp. 1 TL-2023]